MSHSAETQATIATLSNTAAAMWQWPKPKKVIPWATIFEMLLNLFQNCKPKSDQAADKALKAIAVEVAENGVVGCCDVIVDRLPEKKQKKGRKRLMTKIGAKNESDADRVLYTACCAANAHREDCCSTIASAVENDEFEPDEDDD